MGIKARNLDEFTFVLRDLDVGTAATTQVVTCPFQCRVRAKLAFSAAGSGGGPSTVHLEDVATNTDVTETLSIAVATATQESTHRVNSNLVEAIEGAELQVVIGTGFTSGGTADLWVILERTGDRETF